MLTYLDPITILDVPWT